MRDYLTDGQISLRKYRPGDASSLFEAVVESLAELTPWRFYHVGFTLEDAEEEVASCISYWNRAESYSFVIEEPVGETFVCSCRIELVAKKIGARLVRIKPEENGVFCTVYELKPTYLPPA